MIQIIGSTDIHYNDDHIFLSDIKYHLIRNLESFEILSHQTNYKRNQLKINFALNMNEKHECKSLLDYNSYALNELKKRLPSRVDTSYIQTFDIRPVSKK